MKRQVTVSRRATRNLDAPVQSAVSMEGVV